MPPGLVRGRGGDAGTQPETAGRRQRQRVCIARNLLV